MVNVLIPTKPDDTHALYVKLALEHKGHNAMLWYTADYPELQKHTFTLSEAKIEWQASGLELAIENNNQFDVVWLRRPQKPIMPNYLHPDDIKNAQCENDELFKYFWQVVAPNAYWINPAKQVTHANCKLRQLKVAAEVGLNVPDTLITNDPDNIKHFIAKYADNGVIYKPLYPVYWVSEDALRLTYTNQVNFDRLPSDEALQATAGIYQKKINKNYELRVTFMGENAKAVKLNSQMHPRAKIDWRSVSCLEIEMDECELPSEIRQKCISLMNKLGIVFGCFDFIVTPDLEYFFLEINEQGQFLWIEEANPAIKMLDAFVNYLIECGGQEVLSGERGVTLADFSDQVHLLQQQAMRIHKDIGLTS